MSTGHAITAAKKHRRVRPLGVDDLCWELASAPWPNARAVLDLARDALRIIDDELARRAIAQLAMTVVDLVEELAAVREVSSASLTFSAATLRQATLARQRVADLLAADRRQSDDATR